MKKLMMSLATVVLTTGAVADATSFTTSTTTQKHLKSTKPKLNEVTQAQNETPYDIALKLAHKTIKLDPNYWLRKDIKDYRNQLNNTIVNEGILTKAEVQYVDWSSLIIERAAYYKSTEFSVREGQGPIVTDTVILDAGSGSTVQQIVNKIKNAHIRLNYNFWKGKKLSDYNVRFSNYVFENILVNEGILTKAEASTISIDGGLYQKTFTNPGRFAFRFDVTDYRDYIPAQAYVDVVEDGLSAEQLANQIKASHTYFLKPGMQGQYADATAPLANLKQQLLYYNQYNKLTKADLSHFYAPHRKLEDVNNNFLFTVIKDGQRVKANPCTVIAHNYAYMNRDVNSAQHLQFSVNMPPYLVKLLANFIGPDDYYDSFFLGYFYQILNNGHFETLPKVANIPPTSVDPHAFKPNNTLGNLMADFAKAQHYDVSALASNYAEAKDKDIRNFSMALQKATRKAAEKNSSLGIAFSWITKAPYINYYSFW